MKQALGRYIFCEIPTIHFNSHANQQLRFADGGTTMALEQTFSISLASQVQRGRADLV